jgi:hypothetical protein
MRYRKLTATGDYSFGHSQGDFYINQPECVAQSIQTRLQLNQGDWFLDTSAGVPWRTKILGKTNNNVSPRTRDLILKTVLLGTTGLAVNNPLVSFTSTQVKRSLSIAATVNTIYTEDPIYIDVVL